MRIISCNPALSSPVHPSLSAFKLTRCSRTCALALAAASCLFASPALAQSQSPPNSAPSSRIAVQLPSPGQNKPGFAGVFTAPGARSALTVSRNTSSTPQAAAPVFSGAPGSYPTAQTVTISDTTAGATIYYTTDGSYPSTTSPVYSAPVTISPPTVGMNPAATYWEWPVPDPKFQAPVTR